MGNVAAIAGLSAVKSRSTEHQVVCAVDVGWLNTCLQNGRKPERPYRRKFEGNRAAICISTSRSTRNMNK